MKNLASCGIGPRPYLDAKFFWISLLYHFRLFMTNSSCDLQSNCIINFYFYLYLVFYAYVTRFSVTENLKNFLDFGGN